MPHASDPRGPLPFTPRDHDVRVAREGSVFYVRGVKVGEPFVGDVTWDGTLAGLLSILITKAVAAAWWSRADAWKVGVVRFKDTKWGSRARVLHKERLPPGRSPNQRIAELVTAVNGGTFDK